MAGTGASDAPAARSPTMMRRRLGAALRTLRAESNKTFDDVAEHLERSQSWLSRVESGHIGIRNRELRDLLNLYEVRDSMLRSRLEALADSGRRRGWWSDYTNTLSPAFGRFIGFEADASLIRTYEDRVVPGLLQHPDYMSSLQHL